MDESMVQVLQVTNTKPTTHCPFVYLELITTQGQKQNQPLFITRPSLCSKIEFCAKNRKSDFPHAHIHRSVLENSIKW